MSPVRIRLVTLGPLLEGLFYSSDRYGNRIFQNHQNRTVSSLAVRQSTGKAIHQSAAEFRDRQSLAVGWIDSPSVTAVLVVLGDLGVLKTW